MVESLAAGEALRRALDALTDGSFDARSTDGAMVNALESIAWSLVGLLEAQGVMDEETLAEYVGKTLLKPER
jgi:hypothetical protein